MNFYHTFRKNDYIKPVVTLTIYWGKNQWDGCTRISDLFPPDTPKEIRAYACDYAINLITPDTIRDFSLFSTELGDVLEFISKSDSETDMKDMISERGDKWFLSREGLNMINKLTGSNIEPVEEDDEVVDMCRAIQALIDEGKGIGREEGIGIGRAEEQNKSLENVIQSIVEDTGASREEAEKQARHLLRIE